NSRADEQKSLALQIFRAPDRVGEMRITAIDNQIARLQIWQNVLDEFIHRRAGLHHQHDFARPLEQLRHFFERMRADNRLAPLGGVLEEFIDLRCGAIERDHRVPVVVHIEYEVLAHDGEADQGDISSLFHDVAPAGGVREARAHTWRESGRSKGSYSRYQSLL